MLIQIIRRSDSFAFFVDILGHKMRSGCLSALLVTIFGTCYLSIGFSGLENQFGMVWPGAALIVLIVFNLTLPLSLGAYFYTTSILGWHWFEASLFTLVLISIIVPAIIKSVSHILNPASSEN